MIATPQHGDTGLSADAARVLDHPTASLWTQQTRAALSEVAAGRWPIPPLLARRLVVRAARTLEGRRP
jgi:hypothetical protein